MTKNKTIPNSKRTSEEEAELLIKRARIKAAIEAKDIYAQPTIEQVNESWISGNYNCGGYSTEYWLNYWLHLDAIMRFFLNIFEYEGLDRKQNIVLEEILFWNGKAALIKSPDGQIVPVAYTTKKWDITGKFSKEISVIAFGNTTNKIIGKTYKENEFIELYNKAWPLATIVFYLDRLDKAVQALISVDLDALISTPIWAIFSDISDKEAQSIKSAILNARRGGDNIVNLSNMESMDELQLFEAKSRSKELQEYYENIKRSSLGLLGLQVNEMSNKAERVTEMEINRSDVFGQELFKDMFRSRQMNLDKSQQVLNKAISLKDIEYLEQPEKEDKKVEPIIEEKGDKND